ncbi:hypothetical protein D3C77_589950 [compost metagenome]
MVQIGQDDQIDVAIASGICKRVLCEKPLLASQIAFPLLHVPRIVASDDEHVVLAVVCLIWEFQMCII